MGISNLFRLLRDSIVAKVEIVYDGAGYLCRAARDLITSVRCSREIDYVVSDADVDCYQGGNPDDRNVAIGSMLKEQGIGHCVVRGGCGDPKSRESSKTVALRRHGLEIVTAQLS